MRPPSTSRRGGEEEASRRRRCSRRRLRRPHRRRQSSRHPRWRHRPKRRHPSRRHPSRRRSKRRRHHPPGGSRGIRIRNPQGRLWCTPTAIVAERPPGRAHHVDVARARAADRDAVREGVPGWWSGERGDGGSVVIAAARAAAERGREAKGRHQCPDEGRAGIHVFRATAEGDEPQRRSGGGTTRRARGRRSRVASQCRATADDDASQRPSGGRTRPGPRAVHGGARSSGLASEARGFATDATGKVDPSQPSAERLDAGEPPPLAARPETRRAFRPHG